MERAETDLLGRDEEVQSICTAIEADQSVAVIGESGIGKTSVVRAAGAACGRRVHEGGGFATLVAAPMLALSRAVGTDIAGDSAGAAATVERRVGPDLLFIDDLQWVDHASLDALELLVGRIGLVTAIRENDPGAMAATAYVERLGFQVVTLSGLEPDVAGEIVRRVAPGLPASLVDRVVARAGGNPLMLEEMAATGEPTPVLARAIEAGLDRLSPDGRHVVELLAVADRPLERRRLGDHVDEPLRTGTVVERDGAIEIRHAVLAETIRARLDNASLIALHRRVAELVDRPIDAARHLASAGDGAAAMSTAHEALETTADPNERAALLSILADFASAGEPAPRLTAARALSETSDWVSTIQILSRPIAGWPPEARAEGDALLAHALFSLGRHDEAREALERAATYPIDRAAPAGVKVAIETAAFMVNVDGRVLPALDYLEERMAAYPVASIEHFTMRAILESIRMLAAREVDIGFLQASIHAALGAGAYASAADLTRVVGFALLIWQGARPALDFLDDMSRRLDAAGVPGVALEVRAETVQAAVLAGHLTDAVTFADGLLERPSPMRARQTATIYRARALGLMGRLEEASQSLDDLEPLVTADFVGRGLLLAAQAELALWGGMTDRAIELVRAVHSVPAPILGAYGQPGITRAWAQVESGAAPDPVTDVTATPIMVALPRELKGVQLLHAGSPDLAVDRFAEAAALWSGYDMTRELVCRWAEGEALRRAGRHEEMAGRLTAALDEATEHRFETLAVRIRRSMRRAGMHVPPAVTTRARGTLTPRERELVSMVERGLTNIEIARRMGLGRPTVSRLLSNAMVKLDAGSRAQLTVLAAELD